MRVVGHDCPVNEQLKMASHNLGDNFRFLPNAAASGAAIFRRSSGMRVAAIEHSTLTSGDPLEAGHQPSRRPRETPG